MSKGLYLNFEGPEGAGKSTAILDLQEWLATLVGEQKVHYIKQPGYGALGAKIRQLLLHDVDTQEILPEAEVLLFCADRAHTAEQIRQFVDAGHIVLGDRGHWSTLVYQGHTRGLDLVVLEQINKFGMKDLLPDRNYLFDIDVSVGLARQGSRNRMEAEGLEFHQKVREGYLELFKRYTKESCLIDASKSQQEVLSYLRHDIQSRFGFQLQVN